MFVLRPRKRHASAPRTLQAARMPHIDTHTRLSITRCFLSHTYPGSGWSHTRLLTRPAHSHVAPLTRPAHSPRSLALLTRSKEEKAEDLEKRSEEEKVRAEEEAKVSDPLYHQSVGVAQTIAMVRALLYPSMLAPLTSQSVRPTSLRTRLLHIVHMPRERGLSPYTCPPSLPPPHPYALDALTRSPKHAFLLVSPPFLARQPLYSHPRTS